LISAGTGMVKYKTMAIDDPDDDHEDADILQAMAAMELAAMRAESEALEGEGEASEVYSG